ncbi:uncharacterized protein L201_000887 [Kwoniella dendrophila CBS 6074]|uniref:Uncharacterized protein n=1 Tax=Kwoniella dendrophila CBS 6074 TaxID=1295534 RepID=A0AAX4JLZ6_9TREE
MDEEIQPYRGMLACFPCMILWKWGRGRLAKNDPEHEPLFPSPSTILTPPRPHSRPRLPNINSSSSSFAFYASEPTSPTKSTGYGSGYFGEHKRAASSSRLSQEGKERLGSISRAYANRMQSLDPPSHNSSPIHSTPHNQSGYNTPNIRPLSAFNPLTTTSNTTSYTLPYRPPALNLGRSASEPRNLNDLGGFAPHQIPAFCSINVGRGGIRGNRRRSATVTDRLHSPLALNNVNEGNSGNIKRDRGRSPGPKLAGHMIHDTSDNDFVDQSHYKEETDKVPKLMGRSLSHPGLTTITNDLQDDTSNEDQEQDEEQVVVKRELGLRGLRNGRGSKRGKSKSSGRGGKRIKSN